MSVDFCKACNGIIWTSTLNNYKVHACRPAWVVWSEEKDPGGQCAEHRPIRAASPAEAVERWAALDDAQSADYSIAGGCDAAVSVRPFGDHEATPLRYIVSGETVANYSARLVVSPPSPRATEGGGK